MTPPRFEDLPVDLQKHLNPENPKVLMMVAKGLAPLPPPILVSCWTYFLGTPDSPQAADAEKSLAAYPEKSLSGVLAADIPGWALFELGKRVLVREELLEIILLNANCPVELFLLVSPTCSERIATLIANNQERIIESPEIIPELEKNPNNLKSNTDRLRQFLRLAGVFVPGGAASSDNPGDSKAQAPAVDPRAELADEAELSEEKRQSLTQYILTLNVGAKVKLAVKGNKEARSILVRDTNKVVATQVLKSPKITENEVLGFSSLKHLSEDVIRGISRNPFWTKNYSIKVNLVTHPKTPVETAMNLVKFLNLRDLTEVSRSKTIMVPVRKVAKSLLAQKRK